MFPFCNVLVCVCTENNRNLLKCQVVFNRFLLFCVIFLAFLASFYYFEGMASNETEKRRSLLNVWLAEKNMSRIELAKLCNVSESTVYGWLSNTNISDRRWEQIKVFFEPPDEEKAPEAELLRAVAVGFTSEELSDLKMIAGDKPLDVLLRELALERMNDILNKE